MARGHPSINVCVYAYEGEPITVDVCESDLNPIRVEVGGLYVTNKLSLFLGAREAAALCDKLSAALRDFHGECWAPDDTVTLADGSGIDLAAEGGAHNG